MEQTRQQKIARLLQKELGDIFLLYAKKHPGALITVSEVRVTPDLGMARVYLSLFPEEKAADLLPQIQEDTKAIRYDLGSRLRHQLRIIPGLSFHRDDTLGRLETIDRLLNS